MTVVRRTCCLLLAAWGLVLAGCDASSLSDDGRTSLGSSVTPRTAWRASGDLRDPAKAIDGDLSTAAMSGESYAGASLTIDLGKPCLFNRVIVEHGDDEFACPHRLAVATSLDGQEFTPRDEVLGTRRVTNVLLITPVLARYVRLTAAEPGPRAWAVAEVLIQ